MKTPAAPPPPDPIATAQAQGAANLETAIGNTAMANANEFGPGGSVRYEKTGVEDIGGGKLVPTYTKYTTLAPDEKTLYDQSNALNIQMQRTAGDQLGRLGTALAQPFGPDGLPAAATSLGAAPTLSRVGNGPALATGYRSDNVATTFGDPSRGVQYGETTFGDAGPITRSIADAGEIQSRVGPTDFSADRLRVEQALNDRLSPQLARTREALETRLVNQGLTRGTAAFNAAADEASRQENDARLAVTAAGGQEQSRLFADALLAGGFANSAQAQRYGQNANTAAFENSAQAQGFSQARDRGLFGLSAIQQNNTAQGQEYDQLLGRAGFSRDSTLANNAMYAAQAGFGNDAAQQMYGNQVGAATFNNQVGQAEFGNTQTAADYANTARERALQEAAYFRNQPINEIGALTNGVQINVPQFSPFKSASFDPAPIASSVYNTAQIANDQYKSKLAANQAMMSGLFGLGGSLASAGGYAFGKSPSDRRLKEKIRPLGINTSKGVPLYAYRFRSDPTMAEHVGCMADEVLPLMPSAVFMMPNGFMGVDYAQVL
jgi:hypothetical protein